MAEANGFQARCLIAYIKKSPPMTKNIVPNKGKKGLDEGLVKELYIISTKNLYVDRPIYNIWLI